MTGSIAESKRGQGSIREYKVRLNRYRQYYIRLRAPRRNIKGWTIERSRTRGKY